MVAPASVLPAPWRVPAIVAAFALASARAYCGWPSAAITSFRRMARDLTNAIVIEVVRHGSSGVTRGAVTPCGRGACGYKARRGVDGAGSHSTFAGHLSAEFDAVHASPKSKIKRVVLAYSGGLDTSIILKWLQTE